MNTFMNLVKRSSVKERIRGGIGASGGIGALVKASSLLAFNPRTGLWPASLSCSPVGLARELTQGLYQAQGPEAITMEI